MTIQPSYNASDADAGLHQPTVELPAENVVAANPPDGHLGFRSVGNTFSYVRGGYARETAGDRQAQVQHGPVLTFAGERFRPEWLFEFLKRPTPTRQYLLERDQGRMPYFNLTDQEAADLVVYFMALADEPYPYDAIDHEQDPALVRIGHEMFRNEAGCASGACHPATEPTEQNLASDLAHAGRLKPDWIEQWVTSPEGSWPGNGVPDSPWEVEDAGPYPAHADGDVATQMRALRDYVLTLGRG